jgi:sugar lactone lactonase YvrE
LDVSGICAYAPRTRVIEPLCAFEPGLNTRPNDARTDRRGNLIVGSYNGNHRGDGGAIGGVYRLAAESPRALTEVLDYKIRVSNATCFTPDGKIMFFCDSPTRAVYAFQVRSSHTGPHTTASAWWTSFLKDFSRRISPPTPRFQSPPSTPFNSN